ncbi:DUF2809 domain-containing protein [Clostridium massiliamazoniense]|uniref:ribosomal maturation YjgA family protein n=1 Tax=Clostridium massiliamazoniense TaxID=1347366 RepID=UPI0006D7FDD2|nr:DUF2809 domain-containing protein [Clostridium massiliamazoniense]
MSINKSRNRIVYIVLFMLVICLGIGSRKFSMYLPKFIADYSGDTLWAMMVYLGFAFIFNELEGKKVLILALVFSYFIEFSQLYQGQLINSIRSTTIGGLVLGHGFLFSDLICYSVGILLIFYLEKVFLRIKR